MKNRCNNKISALIDFSAKFCYFCNCNESYILRGTAQISINLIVYTVKEQMIVITPTNSLIELLELTPDYDFQIIVPENDFLPVMQNSNLMDSYINHGIILPLSDEEWQHTGVFFSLLWETMHKAPFRKEVVQHIVTALLYDIRYSSFASSTFAVDKVSGDELTRKECQLINMKIIY